MPFAVLRSITDRKIFSISFCYPPRYGKMHLADSGNLHVAVIIIIIIITTTTTILNVNMSYRERACGHSCVQSNVESGNLCSWKASVQAELRSAASDELSVTL